MLRIGQQDVPHGRSVGRKTRRLWAVAVVVLILAGSFFLSVVVNKQARGTVTPLDVVVVGDSYTAGSNMGGNNEAGWASIATSRLSVSFPGLAMTMSAQGGTGYTTPGTNYLSLVQRGVRPNTDGVVLFGSRNDLLSPDVGSAVSATLGAVRSIAPTAQIMVIGPPWTSERVPSALLRVRDEMKVAVEAAGATFVDPLSERWFFGEDARLIGADGIHPTDAGHQYMEYKVEPNLRTFLENVSKGKSPSQ